MGKSLDWIQEEPTGRLIFRRAYPEALRPFLDRPGQRELKVSLGVRRTMTVGAWASYEQAKRRFDRDVSKATAAKRLEETDRAGRVDQLTPALIDFLAAAWKVEILELDHEARWTKRPTEAKLRASRNLRAEIESDLEEALTLRGLGDLDAIVAAWGHTAIIHAEAHGYRLDADGPEVAEYVRVLHDSTIESWQSILRRLRGDDVPTPELPTAPGKAAEGPAGKSFEAIVETLLDSPRNPISATTREGVRTALRLFRETHGTPAPEEITRAMVAEWLDLRHAAIASPLRPAGRVAPGRVERDRCR